MPVVQMRKLSLCQISIPAKAEPAFSARLYNSFWSTQGFHEGPWENRAVFLYNSIHTSPGVQKFRDPPPIQIVFLHSNIPPNYLSGRQFVTPFIPFPFILIPGALVISYTKESPGILPLISTSRIFQIVSHLLAFNRCIFLWKKKVRYIMSYLLSFPLIFIPPSLPSFFRSFFFPSFIYFF